MGSIYNNLTQAQRKLADQLFRRALQCAKNNDMVGAANYYRQSADNILDKALEIIGFVAA